MDTLESSVMFCDRGVMYELGKPREHRNNDINGVSTFVIRGCVDCLEVVLLWGSFVVVVNMSHT